MSAIRDIMQQGVRTLRNAGIESARLDVSVLLAHVLGVERSTLYAHPEREATTEEQQRFRALIERRAHGEPVAYLVGHKEFYGLDFVVDQRVLIPRPETEQLVEAALGIIGQRIAKNGQAPLVADIGTGSGAIPIALAVTEPRLPYLYASDISSDALAVAQLNCRRHHVENRVRLLQGDLLAPLPEPVDILTANLPYVGEEEMDSLATDVRAFEPHEALFSGLEGLDLLRRFAEETRNSGKLRPGAAMLLEIGYRQREELTELFQAIWPHASITGFKDYSGQDRLLKIFV